MTTLAVAKPIKHIPAAQTIAPPDVHVGMEFPSLGWWWKVESINRDSGLMVIRPTRPTNKMIKLTNEKAGR